MKKYYLVLLALVFSFVTSAQTYYNMGLGNYSETFTSWSGYSTNWNGLAVLSTGAIPVATKTTTATNGTLAVVATSTGIGYDAATSSKLVFLCTGSTDNSAAVACDLNLDFTSRLAGNLSFDYALILNTAAAVGRASSFIVYASADGGANWTTLAGPYTLYNTTGSSTSAVSITNIALPSTFNNAANCKLRFYEYNGGTVVGTPSGSRPKISLDNVSVTSTPATTPSITAAPNISNVSTTVGTASAPQNFTLSALNLSPASGNITLTPSANVEISTDGGSTYYTTAQTVAYTSGTLSSTTIYAKIASTAPQGVFSGTITCSGGSATDAVVTISGAVTQNYYNTKSNSGLDNVATWSSSTDGLGASPTDFTTNYQNFNIINQTNANYSTAWTVSGTGSKIIVGDGTNACNFTVSAANTVTSTIDVANAGTLTIQNATAPTLGVLATGSTVDYNNVTITLPSTKTYSNLKISGTGTKTFPGGITTVNGNLVLNGTTIDAPGASPFATISLGGDLTYVGTVTPPAAATNQITLQTKGTNAGTQTITAASNVVRWFRIQTTTANTILVNNASNVYLGNPSGGGLTLLDGSVLNLNGNDLQLYNGASTSFVLNTTGMINTGSISALSSTCDIILERTNSGSFGTIRFQDGAFVNNLTINHTGLSTNTLVLGSNLRISGILTLTKGVIQLGAYDLWLFGGTISGGDATSYVSTNSTGSLIQNLSSSQTKSFPVGNSAYNPVSIKNGTSDESDFMVRVIDEVYADGSSSGTALTTSRVKRTWNIYKTNPTMDGTGVDFVFNWNVADEVGITNPKLYHYENSAWTLQTGTTTPGTNSVSYSGYTGSFLPSAFAVLEANSLAPVSFVHFSGVRQSNLNKLTWSTATEMNNTGFDVQSSADGINWTTLAFVPTKAISGNSNAILSYEYKDAREGLGNTYYRLRQVDLDGKYSFSSIVLIKANATHAFAIENIYPNPVKRNTTIWIASSVKDKATILVTDESGRKYMAQSASLESGSNAIPLNLSTLAPGNYFIKVMNSKGESRSTQLIKE